VGERGGYHAELARVWGPPGYPPREFPPTVRKLSEDDIAVQGPGIYELQPMVRHPNGKVVPAGDHPRRIEVSEALWRAAMLRAGRGAELPPDPHFEPEPEPEAEADEPPPPGAGGDSSALWWRMGQAVEGLRADVRNMRQPAPQAGPGGVPADPFYSQHGERMVPASLLSEVREQLTDQHSKAVAEYERRITRLENDHEKALRDLETRLRGSHTAELAVVEAKLEAATERREGMRRELDRMQSDLDDKRVELREARLAAIEAKGGAAPTSISSTPGSRKRS